MTDYQISVIRCALADLSGSWVEHEHGYQHDWEAHQKTIDELIDAFPELNLLETT